MFIVVYRPYWLPDCEGVVWSNHINREEAERSERSCKRWARGHYGVKARIETLIVQSEKMVENYKMTRWNQCENMWTGEYENWI